VKDSRRAAPQLQVPLVARPRNHLYRHGKVATLWRPFRLLATVSIAARFASQLDPDALPFSIRPRSPRRVLSASSLRYIAFIVPLRADVEAHDVAFG
jgi:hypothetical protein